MCANTMGDLSVTFGQWVSASSRTDVDQSRVNIAGRVRDRGNNLPTGRISGETTLNS